MRRLQALSITVVAALALAACGAGGTSAEPGPSAEVASSPSAEPSSAAGEAAPAEVKVPQELEFTSTTTTGASFEGASLAGKPAVLWFWAPWCHVCKEEAPTVRSAAEVSNVNFVGVAALDSAPAMQGFVENFGLDFTNLADTEAAVWAKFGVTSQPSFAFISASGEVDVVSGRLSASQLKSKIAELEKS